MSEQRVSRLEDLPPGEIRFVELAGVKVALARVGDTVYACGDTCPHQGGPLSGGKLYGTRLACPWHGWSFDVKTGVCLFPSRGGPVPTFPVRVTDGEVFVELP